jgi:DUF1680 family protein
MPWATHHIDRGGGLPVFEVEPTSYRAKIDAGGEAIKLVESMASVVGLERDEAIEGLVRAWAHELTQDQDPAGYWRFGWPLGADRDMRWKPEWWSHEDYLLGHYLEAAIAYLEATGDPVLYQSAVAAIDDMAVTFLGDVPPPYAPGHAEIEQALTRLYGITGEQRYLDLCGWLIAQRGRHEGRPSFGPYAQDHLPIEDQRTIEGHAVRAAFLFNGVTEYVGATGHHGYREALLSIWRDLVERKLYLHGVGGNVSANNEGYLSEPYVIAPNDCYGESCSAFGNFQWAHSLFRLTGDASYLDVAEQMLHNTLAAALSLSGDRFFYRNVAQSDEPVARFEWHVCPCCPPNITKLIAKVGGFLYSTDADGIYVKHYAASEANIPAKGGVRLIQDTSYPWDGSIAIRVEPTRRAQFVLHLRIPRWAKSHSVSVNGEAVLSEQDAGWIRVDRLWTVGDVVQIELAMPVERVTMPPEFKDYRGLVALQRGPSVYCLEQLDAPEPVGNLCLPDDAELTLGASCDSLGGATVIKAELLPKVRRADDEKVPVTFVPYAVWNNRVPGPMRIWLPNVQKQLEDVFRQLPTDPPGSEHMS